ncbi:MAG: hypothetical protein JXA21_04195 [Anaerolineae bacterium]|nr:hypothetical protein [Anaerolineae bacterium]
MPPELTLEFNRLTEALRRHRAVGGLGWGLAVALGVSLAAALAARILPIWYRSDLVLSLVWILLGGGLVGITVGYSWSGSLSRRLRLFDRRLGLAERLTTAWELARSHITAPETLIKLQREETLNTLRSVEPQTVFPARLPRASRIAILVLGILLIPALFLENPQEIELAKRAAQQQIIAEAAEQLKDTRDALEQAPLSEAEREAALKALDEALKTLNNPRSTTEEQLAALAEAERQLAELHSPESEQRIQNLAEAAPLSAEDVVQPLAEALQRGDVEAAAEYLRALTDPLSGRPLTPEEIAALADAFNQIADQLQQSDPELAQQFRDITQEIYRGDAESAREAIQKAAGTLSEVAQENGSNQSLEEAQAGLQQAQEKVGGQSQTAQNPAKGGNPQQGNSGQQGQQGNSGQQGQQGNSGQQGQQGNSGNGNGQGTGGHSEDSGSSAPYGNTETARLEGQGGEISIPREKTEGQADPQTGLPGPATVPYREVYTEYAEAAEASLSRNAYPPALRTYVREYFGGLEP